MKPFHFIGEHYLAETKRLNQLMNVGMVNYVMSK